MSDRNSIQFDEWVGSVRPDPQNAEALVIVQGFVGKSSEEGHIRVYSDESLNSFAEIPEDGIVYSVPLPKETSPLGGSKLWIKANTVLVYGDPNSRSRQKASFLEGEIMQQQPAGEGEQKGPGPLTLVNCGPVTQNFICPSLNRPNTCNVNLCQIKNTLALCVSRFCTLLCPTHNYKFTCIPQICNIHVSPFCTGCAGGTVIGPGCGGGSILTDPTSPIRTGGIDTVVLPGGFANPGFYGAFNPYETPMGM